MTIEGRRSAVAPLLNGERSRFIRFLLVGGLNTLVGYGIFAALVLLGAGPSAALAAATVLGITFNFKSIGDLVFGGAKVRLLPRFVGVYAIQFLANLAALRALVEGGLPPLLAQLILLPLLSIATFVMMRQFVFRHAAIVHRDDA